MGNVRWDKRDTDVLLKIVEADKGSIIWYKVWREFKLTTSSFGSPPRSIYSLKSRYAKIKNHYVHPPKLTVPTPSPKYRFVIGLVERFGPLPIKDNQKLLLGSALALNYFKDAITVNDLVSSGTSEYKALLRDDVCVKLGYKPLDFKRVMIYALVYKKAVEGGVMGIGGTLPIPADHAINLAIRTRNPELWVKEIYRSMKMLKGPLSFATFESSPKEKLDPDLDKYKSKLIPLQVKLSMQEQMAIERCANKAKCTKDEMALRMIRKVLTESGYIK